MHIYITNYKKNHNFKKISSEKIPIFQLAVAKKVQNLTISEEIISYLRNQIAKNQLKKSFSLIIMKNMWPLLVFREITAYLHDQCKQKSQISKNQP